MPIVIALWVAAMTAGLCWGRSIIAVTSLASVALAGALHPHALARPAGWCELIVLGVSPWLLAAQRGRFEKLLKRAHLSEALHLTELQKLARSLTEWQSANQDLESQIGRITDVYHVTRATARAMRVDELFEFSLDILPRLLDLRGVRLIDLALSLQTPMVLRAHRTPDGRLMREGGARLLPIEHEIVQLAIINRTASTVEAGRLESAWPAGVSRFAWAPLWSEQKAVGVLIADELPAGRLDTLTIVANQLSLQLARIHLYEAIESMAVTDTLTGVFVRRYFLDLAAEELTRSGRHGLPCGFLMVDLDAFKSKNDTYGHLVGDVVLREVAQLLRRNLRGIDFIARYGGEEFILLLIETAPDQAMAVAERLRQLVEVQPIRAYDEALNQTVSMGVACFPEDGKELPELIERADQALYAAKRAGRNRVVRWSKKADARLKTQDSSLGS